MLPLRPGTARGERDLFSPSWDILGSGDVPVGCCPLRPGTACGGGDPCPLHPGAAWQGKPAVSLGCCHICLSWDVLGKGDRRPGGVLPVPDTSWDSWVRWNTLWVAADPQQVLGMTSHLRWPWDSLSCPSPRGSQDSTGRGGSPSVGCCCWYTSGPTAGVLCLSAVCSGQLRELGYQNSIHPYYLSRAPGFDLGDCENTAKSGRSDTT